MPLASLTVGAAFATPSLKTNRTVSSIAERARGETTIAEPLGDARVRVFVFLPGAHVGRVAERAGRDLLAGAFLFEGGRDVERVALDRQHHREEALAQPPPHPAEVHERGAAGEHERVDLPLRHQAPRLLDTASALVG